MTKVTQLQQDYTLEKDLHKSLGISLGDGCQVLSCCVIESHWKMTVNGRSSIQFWFISAQLEQTLWVAVAVAAKHWSCDSGAGEGRRQEQGQGLKCVGSRLGWIPGMPQAPFEYYLHTFSTHHTDRNPIICCLKVLQQLKEDQTTVTDLSTSSQVKLLPKMHWISFFNRWELEIHTKKGSVIFSLLQNKVPCSAHLIFGWMRHLNLHIMYGFFCFHPLPRFKIYGYHLGWFQFPLIICATDVHLSDFNHVVVTGLA